MENLFINKEYEIRPDATAALSIMLILAYKPWTIQDMKIWMQ